MVVHCVLTLLVGDELIPMENIAENDQGIDDLLTAEHHSHRKHLNNTTLLFSHTPASMISNTMISYFNHY